MRYSTTPTCARVYFDHDLDFRNEYEHFAKIGEQQQPPDLAVRNALLQSDTQNPNPITGKLRNVAPVGSAIMWAPGLCAGRYGRARGQCAWRADRSRRLLATLYRGGLFYVGVLRAGRAAAELPDGAALRRRLRRNRGDDRDLAGVAAGDVHIHPHALVARDRVLSVRAVSDDLARAGRTTRRPTNDERDDADDADGANRATFVWDSSRRAGTRAGRCSA